MFTIELKEQWYSCGDQAMEATLTDLFYMSCFVGNDRILDATTTPIVFLLPEGQHNLGDC